MTDETWREFEPIPPSMRGLQKILAVRANGNMPYKVEEVPIEDVVFVYGIDGRITKVYERVSGDEQRR